MALPDWIDKKVTKNSLFLYDFLGFEVDRKLQNSALTRVDKSYLLEWVFTNTAQGFSELLTKIPERINSLGIDTISSFKEYYRNELYPTYTNRKKAYMFRFGENMSYIDISDVDITSKAFGPNDNFADDTSSVLDAMYNF